MTTNHFLNPSRILAASLVLAGIFNPVAASPHPLLPVLPAVDVRGAAIFIYVDEDGSLVDQDGELVVLDDHTLEILCDDFEHVTLIIVAPRGASVSVVKDGLWTEIDPFNASELLENELFGSSVGQTEGLSIEIEIPGQPRPTELDVVLRPPVGNPRPR